MFVNGLGAVATGATTVVVILSKFIDGAWITVIAIPALLGLMYTVHRHYQSIGEQVATDAPLDLSGNTRPIVVLPLLRWSKLAQSALRTALAISDDVRAVLVLTDEAPPDLAQRWNQMVVEPATAAGVTPPELERIQSPYRFVVGPIVDYVVRVSHENPTTRVIVMVPELMENRWYNYALHAHRATVLIVVLGLAVWVYLPDRPDGVRWLTPEQRNWLTERLTVERVRRVEQHRGESVPRRRLCFRAPQLLPHAWQLRTRIICLR